jgi:hypothetical protein
MFFSGDSLPNAQGDGNAGTALGRVYLRKEARNG